MKISSKLILLIAALWQIGISAFAQSYTSSFTSNGGNPGAVVITESTGATAAANGFTAITPTTGAQSVNSWSAATSIGFTFEFFGQPVTDYKVSHNGLLTFNTSAMGVPPSANGNLPDATLPDKTVCVMWDAFTGSTPTGTNDYVAYKTFGTAPNRQHWVWWYSFEYGNPFVSFHHMAAVLEETTNKIYIVDLGSTTAQVFLSSTVGVQLNSTTAAQFGTNTIAQAGNGTTSNADNDYWTFTPTTSNCTNAPASVSVGFSPASVCPGTTATLTGAVTPAEAGQVYQWESSPDDITYTAISGATSTSYSTTVTSALYYRMTAACGAGTPTVSTGVQITPLSATLPYSQNFTGATLPISDCWSIAKGQLTTTTVLTNSGVTWTADGWINNGTTGAARVFIGGAGLYQWLMTPSFTLSGANKQAEFDVALATPANGTGAGTLGIDDQIAVVISLDNGITWSNANILKTWTSTTPISNTGEHVVLDLSAYANTSIKLGFYAESTASNQSNDFFVDNFAILDVPACAAPSILQATAGINSDKAFLSWTNPVVSANGYEWIVVPTGAGSGATAIDFGTTIAPANTDTTASILMPSTTYDVFVRSACTGSNSAWVGPTTFTTECTAAMDISQNFDGVTGGTNGTIPSCWKRLTGGGSSYLQTSNAIPWSGFQRYIFIASTGQTPMAISPVVNNLNDQTKQLRFHAFVSAAGAGKTIQVGYMTDPNNAATFNLVSDITLTNTAPDANWTIVHIPATAPSTGYLAWRHPGTSSYNLYFDDVYWETTPLCGDVSGLTVTNPTTTGFKVAFTAPTTGTPVQYNYEIRTYGLAGTGPTGLAASGATTLLDTTFTTLDAGRRYGVFIQTDCGSGAFGNWFGPVYANTLSNNDECTSAISLAVNPDLLYTATTLSSTAGATLSAGNVCNPAATVNPNNDDVWFSFTATDVAHEIKFGSPFGGTPYSSDLVTAVYSGTCAALTQIDCQDPETFTITGLTAGQTYYLRTFSKSATLTTISTHTLGVGTPPGMTYNTTTASNITTTDVNAGASDAQILRVEVSVSGANSPLTLTDLSFNTNGSTSIADIASAKVYYTGTSTTFSTATPFGTTISVPASTTLNFTGNQALTGGSAATTINYFWLVYDVACGATVANVLDAELDSHTISGTTTSLLLTPAGTRNIIGNSAYDTKAAGNWNDINTWACGVPPMGTTAPINVNHDVTVNTNVDIDANVTIAAAKKLTIASNSMKMGATGGSNKTLNVNGTLDISANTLTINGNLNFNTGSRLTMTGGNITIDPNDGTLAGSVAAGVNSLNIATNNFGMTGGKITIVDPNFNSSGSALSYSGTAHTNLTGGTIAFGDGVSTTDGGAIGFNTSLFVATGARLSLYDFEMNTLAGINRFATNSTGFVILNDFNLLSGEFRSTSGFDLAGNWVNNGKFTSNNTVYFTNYASATSTATTKAQLISGTGVFEGSTSFSNFQSLQVNNINAAGVTFVNDITVAATLTLAQGPITINNLTVGLSTSSLGSITNGAGRVNGTLTKWFGTTTGSTIFRVGTLTNDRIATINFTQALATGGTLSTKFNASVPTTAGLPMIQGISTPVNIEAISPTGYWTVTAANGLAFGASSAYTFTANASGFTESNGVTTLSNLSQIRLIKRADSASDWLPIGSVNNPGTGVTPTALTSVFASSLKSFSDFAIGGSNAGIGVSLQVQAKVFLNNVDNTTGLMNSYLSTLTSFPLSDPYSTANYNTSFVHVNSGATATTTPAVLAVTGNDAIVDWLFLELRDGVSGSTSVVQTKAALLQADGDVVSTNGVSPVAFFGTPASFYVTVRHRFHTGFRTANPIALSNTPTVLNFTNGSTPLFGAYPTVTVGLTSPVEAMNGGDANADGSIDAFDTIIWEIQNGLFDDYLLNSDYNMDGSVDAFDTIIWEINNGKYQELD